MSTPTIEAMAERLERLEREGLAWRRAALRWRRAAALALVGAAILVAAGARRQEPPKTVTAERFILAGPDGKPRGAFEIIEGAPSLSLFDPDGNRRASLAAGPDGGPYLAFADGEGTWRMAQVMSPDGSTRQTFSDAKGREVVVLGMLPKDGGPTLNFRGPDAKPRLDLGLDADHRPVLHISDDAGDPRLSIGTGGGEFRALLYRPHWKGPESESGVAAVVDFRAGMPRLSLYFGGKPIFQSPSPDTKPK